MAAVPLPEFVAVTHLFLLNPLHITNISVDDALRCWHIPPPYTFVAHALDALFVHLVPFYFSPSPSLGILLLLSAMVVAMNSLSSDSLILATLLSAFLVALFVPAELSPILSLSLAYLPSRLH